MMATLERSNTQLETDLDLTIQTIRNLKNSLVIRPTFFEKQLFIANIIDEINTVTLCICANKEDVENIQSRIRENTKVEYITYRLMSLNSVNINSLTKYGLIIFSEAHLIYGENSEKYVIDILDRNRQAVRLGITSTPNRGDGKKIANYFDNNLDTSYTVDEAIRDKHIPDICYICSLDSKSQEDYLRTTISKATNEEIRKILDVLNIEQILNNALAECNIHNQKDINIVAFIPSGEIYEESFEQLQSMLKAAFRNSDIIGKVRKTGTNTYKPFYIKSDGHNDNRVIRLIVNPNLNDNKIGNTDIVILLRKTASKIQFTKQIGFALSKEATHTQIILDLVGNINAETLVVNSKSSNRGSSGVTRLISSDIVKASIHDYRVELKDLVNKLNTNKRSIEFRAQDDRQRAYEEERVERIRHERYPELYNKDGTRKSNNTKTQLNCKSKEELNKLAQELAIILYGLRANRYVINGPINIIKRGTVKQTAKLNETLNETIDYLDEGNNINWDNADEKYKIVNYKITKDYGEHREYPRECYINTVLTIIGMTKDDKNYTQASNCIKGIVNCAARLKLNLFRQVLLNNIKNIKSEMQCCEQSILDKCKLSHEEKVELHKMINNILLEAICKSGYSYRGVTDKLYKTIKNDSYSLGYMVYESVTVDGKLEYNMKTINTQIEQDKLSTEKYSMYIANTLNRIKGR